MSDRRVAVLLALAALVAYLANARLHLTSDGTPHALTAASWLLRGDADLDEYLGRATFSGRFLGPHFYSWYPPGTPLVVLPLVGAALATGASLVDPIPLAILEKLFGALAAAASVGLVFLACRRLASAQASFVAALVYAFATSTWSTSGQQLTMHAPSQLFIALGLYLLARGDRWSARAGLALGVATLVRPTDAFVAAAGALASGRRGARELGRYLAWGLPCIAFLAVYNALVFGAPWRQSYPDEPWLTTLDGYAGSLVSPSRGLFVYSPILLLALAGFALAWFRGRGRLASLVRDTSLAAVATWLVYATFGYWWGGWTYGNRYLSDVLPAFALATAYAVDSGALASAAARAAAALAFAWSALLQFAGAAYFYELWDGRHWDVTPNIDETPWRVWDWADTQWAFVLRHMALAPDVALATSLVGVALAAVLLLRAVPRSTRAVAVLA